MDAFAASRTFAFEKSIVLNAIYDVIDALGLVAEHVNSERGVLIVTAPDKSEMRVMVDTVFPSRETSVKIADAECLCAELAEAFFDELNSTLRVGYGEKPI